ncbi:MAG: adenylate/guanylate cyclase domain-containing protein [Ilumatobacteraceae bacterium]
MKSRLSIRSKLMVLLVFSGVVGALSIGVIAYEQGDAALRESTWDQLISTRSTKRACMQRWLDQQFSQFRVFAGERQLPDALAAFTKGFTALDTDLTATEQDRLMGFYEDEFIPTLPASIDERGIDTYLPDTRAGARLQVDYIVDNPNPAGSRELLETRSDSMFAGDAVDAYDAAHREYHADFVRLMNEMKMYDLFLIDARTGDVVYTVEKEADFGTSLVDGPYRRSGLAEAYRAALGNDLGDDGIAMVDFEHYTASFGAPASFLAAPIVVDGDVVGVVAGQVSIDALNSAMTSGGKWVEEGLGSTGEAYLVGPDMTARTDSRFLIEDPDGFLQTLADLEVDPVEIEAIRESGHSILNQKIDTVSVAAALSGATGEAVIADYRGVEVMSAYAPIEVGGEQWAIIIEKDVSEALDSMYALRRHILFATGAAAVLLTAFALWSARAFVRPIVRLQGGVERLKAGEDDFRIDESGRDEFASLAAAFNLMISEVRERNRTIAEKTAEYEDLLRNVFPEAVADRVSGGDLLVADTFPNVSVGYLSIEGLEQLMDGLDATQTLGLLNELVDAFDDAAERHGVEKIRTVGDAYLATCGLSTPRLDHRQRMSAFADDAVAIVERFNQGKGCSLTLQVGLASGEVDAGVVGRRRFVYEILGRCVADARRLANGAEGPGIRTTAEFAAASAGRPEGTEA